MFPIRYNLHGAIAQLVERLNRTQEVSGSTPLSSTLCHAIVPLKIHIDACKISYGQFVYLIENSGSTTF